MDAKCSGISGHYGGTSQHKSTTKPGDVLSVIQTEHRIAFKYLGGRSCTGLRCAFQPVVVSQVRCPHLLMRQSSSWPLPSLCCQPSPFFFQPCHTPHAPSNRDTGFISVSWWRLNAQSFINRSVFILALAHRISFTKEILQGGGVSLLFCVSRCLTNVLLITL